MATPHLPLLPAGAPAPDIRAFALLGGIESVMRGVVSSALPLAAYQALGDARSMSLAYTVGGLSALALSFAIPSIGRRVPRRRLYAAGALGFGSAAALAAAGGPLAGAAIALSSLSTVLLASCFNAYLMDYIAREDLGRAESRRLFWAAGSWTFGPFLGVWLMTAVHPAAPFVVSAAVSVALVAAFRRLRFGDGRAIRRAKGPPPNAFAHLGRFARQPRLVAGWALAVTRSCGWMAFFIYVPVFAVEYGLGAPAGGLIVSLGMAGLFASPWLQRTLLAPWGVRRTVIAAFLFGATGWILAAALAEPAPRAAAFALVLAGVGTVLLDVAGSLPFLTAVKPRERAEMAAVFVTFRETSLVTTSVVGGAILAVAPLPAVFLAMAGGFLVAAAGARGLPRRLGLPRRTRPFAAAQAAE